MPQRRRPTANRGGRGGSAPKKRAVPMETPSAPSPPTSSDPSPTPSTPPSRDPRRPSHGSSQGARDPRRSGDVAARPPARDPRRPSMQSSSSGPARDPRRGGPTPSLAPSPAAGPSLGERASDPRLRFLSSQEASPARSSPSPQPESLVPAFLNFSDPPPPAPAPTPPRAVPLWPTEDDPDPSESSSSSAMGARVDVPFTLPGVVPAPSPAPVWFSHGGPEPGGERKNHPPSSQPLPYSHRDSDRDRESYWGGGGDRDRNSNRDQDRDRDRSGVDRREDGRSWGGDGLSGKGSTHGPASLSSGGGGGGRPPMNTPRAPTAPYIPLTHFQLPPTDNTHSPAPPILDSDPHSLPIARSRREILEGIAQHQVVIISGETGSGKSTQVPKYLWEEAQQEGRPCSIICSQPRRIAATSLARRVAEEMRGELGQLVGYHIGMEPLSSPATHILFCTTGILVERLVHNRRSFGQLTHIILDEVHERSLDVDLSLILLKKLLPRFPRIRLILMSATLEGQRFDQYFPLLPNPRHGHLPSWLAAPPTHTHAPWGDFGESEGEGRAEKSTPVLYVQGRSFPVHVYHVQQIYDVIKPDARLVAECENALMDVRPTISRYLYELAVALTIYLDNTNTENRESESILIFLPGLGEIKRLLELCMEKTLASHRLWLIPLHSTIRSEEQSKIFQTKAGHRKVVLSTNIAESSITVPDVRFVIDFGLFKESFFDADTNLATLRMEWCSRANLDQRKGRAGRIRAGLVFRLFHKALYDDLPEYSKAEILRAPLENLILRIKTYGEPVSMLSLALDPPDLSGVVNSIDNLRDAGALTTTPGDLMNALDHEKDDPSGAITHLGRLYERLPLHFRVSRMLLISHCYGYLEEGLIMAACMSLSSPFEVPIRQTLDGFAQKLDQAGSTCSDSLASLFLYREWKYEKDRNRWSSRQRRRWEEQRRVHGATLLKIEALVQELAVRLSENGIQPPAHLLPPSNEEGGERGEGGRGEGEGGESDATPQPLRQGGGEKGAGVGSAPLLDWEEERGRSPGRERRERERSTWRSPSRSLSPSLREVSRDDQLLLTAILYGSFYPNYLQTRFSDPNAWTFACHNMDVLPYDPTRTIEVTHLPEGATKSDLRDLFHECGPIDTIYLENSKGYVTFKKPHHRGGLNLSVIKALKLGSIRRLRLWEDDDRDRDREAYSSRRRRDDSYSYSHHHASSMARRNEGVLGGPFCAFQVSFLNVASKLRTIIPRDSINSTVIDVSLEYAPRYLVSCFMSKSAHNSDTIARETTMLPALPLLAPLLSMIFVPSPHVYFRANRNYNKYLGVQVGHKLVYDFDAIFSPQDLEDVNALRASMNVALSAHGIREPNWARLRRQLLALMTRRRKPLKIREAPAAFHWPTAQASSQAAPASSSSPAGVDGASQALGGMGQGAPDAFSTQEDFLPFSHEEGEEEDEEGDEEEEEERRRMDIFPPLRGMDPPLQEGVDYDSEEELRQSMLTQLEDFERQVFDQGDGEVKRDTPEVVCRECKELLSEITNLEECASPFLAQGLAWRLKDPLGFVFDSKLEDEHLSNKLRRPVQIYHCKANHPVALGVDGSKYLTPESAVEIHGVHNEVILWKTPAWRNQFAMFARDLEARAPRASYAERLNAYHAYTCPCCELTVHNKKAAFHHINSNKHKQQKEEVLRKTKYARHALR